MYCINVGMMHVEISYFDNKGSILTNVANLPVLCIAVKTSSADIGDEHVTWTNFLSKEISYFSTPLPKIKIKLLIKIAYTMILIDKMFNLHSV